MKLKLILLVITLITISGCSLKKEIIKPEEKKSIEVNVNNEEKTPKEDKTVVEEPLHGGAFVPEENNSNLRGYDPVQHCANLGLRYCHKSNCYDPKTHYCCEFYMHYKRWGKVLPKGTECTAG